MHPNPTPTSNSPDRHLRTRAARAKHHSVGRLDILESLILEVTSGGSILED